jgi:hypothetical protein
MVEPRKKILGVVEKNKRKKKLSHALVKIF